MATLGCRGELPVARLPEDRGSRHPQLWLAGPVFAACAPGALPRQQAGGVCSAGPREVATYLATAAHKCGARISWVARLANGLGTLLSPAAVLRAGWVAGEVVHWRGRGCCRAMGRAVTRCGPGKASRAGCGVGRHGACRWLSKTLASAGGATQPVGWGRGWADGTGGVVQDNAPLQASRPCGGMQDASPKQLFESDTGRERSS